MINFEWIWVFALLPLPFLVRALLPAADSKTEAALHTPFLSELKSIHDAEATSSQAQGLRSLFSWLIWIMLIMWTEYCSRNAM